MTQVNNLTAKDTLLMITEKAVSNVTHANDKTITDCVHQALTAPAATTSAERSPPAGRLSAGGDTVVQLHSYALSPGAFVPDKTKHAIWNNECIELKTLIDKRNNAEKVTVRFSPAGHNISVSSKEEGKNLSKVACFLHHLHGRLYATSP